MVSEHTDDGHPIQQDMFSIGSSLAKDGKFTGSFFWQNGIEYAKVQQLYDGWCYAVRSDDESPAQVYMVKE